MQPVAGSARGQFIRASPCPTRPKRRRRCYRFEAPLIALDFSFPWTAGNRVARSRHPTRCPLCAVRGPNRRGNLSTVPCLILFDGRRGKTRVWRFGFASRGQLPASVNKAETPYLVFPRRPSNRSSRHSTVPRGLGPRPRTVTTRGMARACHPVSAVHGKVGEMTIRGATIDNSAAAFSVASDKEKPG